MRILSLLGQEFDKEQNTLRVDLELVEGIWRLMGKVNPQDHPPGFPKVFGKVPQQRLLKEGGSPGTGGEILTGEIVC